MRGGDTKSTIEKQEKKQLWRDLINEEENAGKMSDISIFVDLQ